MPTERFDLTLDEVSLVDDPANDDSRVVLVKHAANPPDEGLTKGGQEMAETEKSLADLKKANEALTKEKDALEKGKMKMEEEADKGKKKMKMMEDNMKKLAAHIDASGSKVSFADDGAVSIEKRADDDFVVVGGERLLKSAMSENVLSALTKQAESIDRLEKAAARESVLKRIQSDIPTFGGDVEHRIALMSAVDSISDEEVRKGVHEILAKASKMGKAAGFSEIGTSDPNAGGTTGESNVSALDALAKEYSAKNNVDYHAAYAAVFDTKEGQELFAKRNAV